MIDEHKFETANIYICTCGKDVSEGDINELITTYIWTEHHHVVLQWWMHRKCFLKDNQSRWWRKKKET